MTLVRAEGYHGCHVSMISIQADIQAKCTRVETSDADEIRNCMFLAACRALSCRIFPMYGSLSVSGQGGMEIVQEP